MKQVCFATSSSWKCAQARQYFTAHGIAIEQANIELPESRSEDVAEIAKEKAEFAYNLLQRPVFVIDGAFHITALDGFPKTMVKFAEKYIGCRGVVKLLEDVTDRSYHWQNVLCYKDGKTTRLFSGFIYGEIVATSSLGADPHDFGSIQRPTGYTKPFSQMTKAELAHFQEHVWQPSVFKEAARYFTNL